MKSYLNRKFSQVGGCIFRYAHDYSWTLKLAFSNVYVSLFINFPPFLAGMCIFFIRWPMREDSIQKYLCSMYIRGFTKFGIKVLWRLQILGYFRTLHLKFQKTRTKIEVVLTLPCWLSQFSWDSQPGRVRTTSILVRAFWNFFLKVLKYSRNCSLHNTLIPNLVKPLMYIVCPYRFAVYNEHHIVLIVLCFPYYVSM